MKVLVTFRNYRLYPEFDSEDTVLDIRRHVAGVKGVPLARVWVVDGRGFYMGDERPVRSLESCAQAINLGG